MKNSQIIISLSIFLLCSSVICSGNFDQLPRQQQKKGGKAAYVLTLRWPEAKDKSSFSTFDGDNFAIEKFQSIASSRDACYPAECPNTPAFNFAKIQVNDQKYLSKYIQNFEKDSYATTKNLWNSACSKKSQTQFFSDLVKVHQKFNIVKALKAKGIALSKTKIISPDQMANALSDLLGGKVPTYYCDTPMQFDDKGNMKPQALSYVHLLLDENLNAAEEQYTLCTFTYCANFVIPPQ